MILQIYKKLFLTTWVQIRDFFLYVFRQAIIVNGYVDDHIWKGIRHRNWGDDLNYYYLRKLTGRPVVFYHNFKLAKWLHLKNYLCIGTLLDAAGYASKETIVWGSGVSGMDRSFISPRRILAVRGKKTNFFCDRYKVACPEVYGDPALLLPLVYQPGAPKELINKKTHHEYVKDNSISREENMKGNVKKQYRLGIIPHVMDQQHPVIKEIRERYSEMILIIDLAHYGKWTDVIDQICSCERILSSSLHGLIASDAYHIPNAWIELSGNIAGGHFKYFDYASSVERTWEKPVKIDSVEDLYNIHTDCASPEVIAQLQKGLIESCPFKIKLGVEV